MARARKLSPRMSIAQFENGYWYAAELKTFAKEIGIPSASKLRKDELEKAVKTFLRTGRVGNPARRALKGSGMKDTERGLRPGLPVVHYTSNKETKNFIVREALKIAPDLKERSGVRYRLNRWREEQLAKGRRITYGDLIKQYIALNRSDEPFKRVPTGRYINFLADFLAKEKDAGHADARKAWEQLKQMDVPKDYASWKKAAKRRK